MPRVRLWVFLLIIFGAWYVYETYYASVWESIQSYLAPAKRGGYFILGGIILYMIIFQKQLLASIFKSAAALDADPRLNKVNIGSLIDSQSYSTPGVRTKHKRNVSALLKKKVAASQQWKCASCSSLLDETYEIDHKIALDHGGTNDPSNLWALCPHCHRKKTVNERIF
jgi:hypothetical protein